MPPEQVEWGRRKGRIYYPNEVIQDPIVENVMFNFFDRSKKGIVKYNTTLESNNSDNYLQHLQEELMDGSLYIEKLLQQKEDITQLVNNEPNDQSLGKLIREIYGNIK